MLISAASTERSLHADWRARGWAVVTGPFDHEEIEALRAEADRLLSNEALFRENEGRGLLLNGVPRRDRLDPVIDISAPFAEAARDRRLLALVKDVLGGESQLFKDKFIAKPPGAIGYAAHQDAAYWPGLDIAPDQFLTAALFLDRATPENGAIECASGLHRQLLTEPGIVADPEETNLGRFTVVLAEPGDVLLLHPLTPHRSGVNRSQVMRRTLLFTYGIDARPDLYGHYQRNRASR